MSDEQQNQDLMVPFDVYLKAGIHIGTKMKTKYMSEFIYKTRPDGLYVLNLDKIDKKLRQAAGFISQYNAEDILVVSRRENGWRPVKLFGKHTGAKVIAGRYPPGILTNPRLKDFMEVKLIIVTDPWPDRNVIMDAMKVNVPVVAFCDTNNEANNIDVIVPCNNKGKKSLGLVFWVIAKEFLKAKGMISSDDEFKAKIEDFTED